MIYILDTNSIIYFLQGYKELDTIFNNIRERKVIPLISVITKIELLSFPDITSKEEIQIEELLNNFDIVELEEEIIEQTIRIRKKFHLKIPDAIIAASALFNNGILITRNEKEFKKIEELKIINPFSRHKKSNI